jgi:two-component system response regulator FixJ
MRLPVIVTASQASVPDAVAAMRAGAFDFIEKPMAEERLMGAVNAAAEMLFKKQPATVSKKIVADRLAKLTDREREVLQHLLQGKLNKEIASELDVSQRTVEGHRSRIREKMNARGVADLIRMVG